MVEADYSTVTARFRNATYDQILAYGKAHRILKRERQGGETVESVNVSATLEEIIEAFFEMQAQKAA